MADAAIQKLYLLALDCFATLAMTSFTRAFYMIFRIFIALVVLISGYIIFEMIRINGLQSNLLSAPAEHVLGNPQGDVTLVEFLDYNCVYCKEVFPIVSQAVSEDGNVRFIPRPVALLEPGPIDKARLAYAAAEQGKLKEMHAALMAHEGLLDEQGLQDLALQTGLDPTRLMEDYDSPKIQELAQNNIDLMNGFRFNSTPTFAIGRKILFMPYERLPTAQELLAMFEESRSIE